jgi:hypothetical protein
MQKQASNSDNLGTTEANFHIDDRKIALVLRLRDRSLIDQRLCEDG